MDKTSIITGCMLLHIVHCFPTAMDLLLVFRRASVQELLGLYAK